MDGVDLRHQVRTIIQVHPGPVQAEVGPASDRHGLIESIQQEDERIFGHRVTLASVILSLSLGHHPPRG
ncbi:MAG: hypothetical protein DMD77_25250 [Candidatus Rokuibacteriota bacterium]|nr:MAG: hypothetical protein DMD77_25250 [Candidatus Rokubacteria bacterium]